MSEPDSGVTTAPPAAGGETPPVQTTTPPVSEDVTNPGGGNGEQAVPFTRFQEVNDKAKAAEDRAAKAEQELEEARQSQQPAPSSSQEDDVDPEVSSLVKKVIEREGYVKKEDLQAIEGRRQYQEDTATLTGQYANSGVPFVAEDVRKYAADNGINVTNKASLDAAYKAMNSDKLLENARNAAITEFQENGGKTSAEKPGGTGGATPPEEPTVKGSSPGERLRSRIANARKT